MRELNWERMVFWLSRFGFKARFLHLFFLGLRRHGVLVSDVLVSMYFSQELF